MTREELLCQLESIRDHCNSMIPKDDPDSIWRRDVEALGIAISELRSRKPNSPESLRTQWRNSATNPPTKKDASKYGMVIVWCRGAEEATKTKWELATSMPECYQFWMPMPEPPEKEEK